MKTMGRRDNKHDAAPKGKKEVGQKMSMNLTQTQQEHWK